MEHWNSRFFKLTPWQNLPY